MLLIVIVSLVRCIVHGIFGIGYVIFPLCLFSLVLQSFVSFGFGYDLLCL